MRNGTGRQRKTSRRRSVTCTSYFLLLQASLAAAFNADWSSSRRHAGAVEQAIAAVNPRSDHPNKQAIHPYIHPSIHPSIIHKVKSFATAFVLLPCYKIRKMGQMINQ